MLLACTIRGPAAMHSLGHGNSHADAGPGEPADNPVVAMARPMTVLTAVIAAVPLTSRPVTAAAGGVTEAVGRADTAMTWRRSPRA